MLERTNAYGPEYFKPKQMRKIEDQEARQTDLMRGNK